MTGKYAESDGFCKLFGSGKDQLVVIMQRGDDGPELRCFASPTNLGVCSVAFSYADTEKGWDTAEEQFMLVDEARAKYMAKPLFEAGRMNT